MAIDSMLAVRRAGLTLLKASTLVTGLVPADSIFQQAPPRLPGYPFIRWGAPNVIPLVGTCLDGNEVTTAVHAFAQGREQDGAQIETAEDHCARIGAAIARALDRRRAAIPGGHAVFAWTGSQLLADDEGLFHAVVNLRIRTYTV